MKYLQLFKDGLSSFEILSDEEAGQLIKAIIAYNNEKEYKLKGALNALFVLFKNEIDRTKENYKTKCLKNKANGFKGGRPKTQNNRTVKNKTQKTQDKDKYNTNASKETLEAFSLLWKDYTLTFLKAQNRRGGSKTKALNKYQSLQAKGISCSEIYSFVENHAGQKIGHQDLERLLTPDNYKQYQEDK